MRLQIGVKSSRIFAVGHRISLVQFLILVGELHVWYFWVVDIPIRNLHPITESLLIEYSRFAMNSQDLPTILISTVYLMSDLKVPIERKEILTSDHYMYVQW